MLVGDVRVTPNQCAALPAPAYCGDDGVRTLLIRGDQLRLTFTPPAGATCADLALVADGYYVPTVPTFGGISAGQ